MRCVTDSGTSSSWLGGTTRRLAAVVGVILLAVAVPLAAHAQSSGLPLSADDLRPTPDPDEEVQQESPSSNQVSAATNKMLSWVEADLGPHLGMKNPRQEWSV